MKAEHGKSQGWYSTHCLICGEKLGTKGNRIIARVTWPDDSITKGYAHEHCATAATYTIAAEQLRKGAKA